MVTPTKPAPVVLSRIAPPLTPRPAPPPPQPAYAPPTWISTDHREGFAAGLAVGLSIGLACVIGVIVVLTR